jgi:peptidoglycan/xylan/chitin deacetylase (PgdA/CDA1 family)
MYHYVRDLQHSRYPAIKGLDVSLFRQQLEFFKENFNVITMEQLIDSVQTGSNLPDNAILLTFDDGYIDNYTYALPLLEEFQMQGSFFIPGKTFKEHKLLDVNKIHFILASADINKLVVDLKCKMDFYRGAGNEYAPTDELYKEYAVANRFDNKDTIFVKRILQNVLPENIRNLISSELFEKYVGVSEEKFAHELYMTKEQIHTLKRHGMYIGVHGYDHYWLGKLDTKQMHKDIDEALDSLEGIVDRNKWIINYPYGNYSDEVIEYARNNGAVLGLSTEVRAANFETDNVYALPRFDCNDFPPKSDNYIKEEV